MLDTRFDLCSNWLLNTNTCIPIQEILANPAKIVYGQRQLLVKLP
jgi:hypothetical protein